MTTRIMGTHGYAAPEYIMTGKKESLKVHISYTQLIPALDCFPGHLTTMSDIYSFGVVLLELLTGRRSLDKSRPSGQQNLVEWGRPLLRDPKKISMFIDRKVEGHYCTTGAQIAALVAYKCLSHSPRQRPTMVDVVKILEPLQDFKDSQEVQNPYLINGCDSNGAGKSNWNRRIRLRKVMASYSDTALYKKHGDGKQYLTHCSEE